MNEIDYSESLSPDFYLEDGARRNSAWSDGGSSGESGKNRDYVQENLRLLNALRNFCSLECHDISLEAEEVKIPSHVALLRARSPALDREFEKGHGAVFKFDWMKGVTLATVHDFLYTDLVRVTSSNILQLVEAAKLLELEALFSRCLQFLNGLGRSEQEILLFVGVFELAEKYDLGVFKELCVDKIVEVQETIIANPRFKSSMMGVPSLLWSLYCKFVRRQSGMFISRSNSSPSPAAVTYIWHCFKCGATSQGETCSWCGAQATGFT